MRAPHEHSARPRLARAGGIAVGYAASLAILVAGGAGCGKASVVSPDAAYKPMRPMTVLSSVSRYDDVRWCDLSGITSPSLAEVIPTLWFNEMTIWPSARIEDAKRVLEAGKNPGLGVRALHAQGITGAGVAVAIIDQNICLDHPEYAGKIAEYHDVGTENPADKGSMHGPAVLSLLAGATMGTAPGARVYFAAAPSWTKDAQYQADALNWIIEKNRTLPAGSKIRAVSISAAPSGPGTPFNKNNAAWQTARILAEDEGILVLDCTEDHGQVTAGYYDLASPDDITKFTLGFPGWGPTIDTQRLYAPTSNRTTAEEYFQGEYASQFTGEGGLSWAIPYVTGVLALGWQLRPELTGEQMLTLAFASAHEKDGAKIIDPPAFIDKVRAF